ncbi:hypothetical protein HMPREF0080_01648 [Anaeroglobus geminatus F0357]|uniref:Uncharacterized protein n=1 Tax=Anaeroglobus geminatus F0357 TaxID=861450 RepID=G9YJ04_9FIRM|nr:hypothetical protein HMPREF0080_01648 [Anaeroglobus geminatus F0357]
MPITCLRCCRITCIPGESLHYGCCIYEKTIFSACCGMYRASEIPLEALI